MSVCDFYYSRELEDSIKRNCEKNRKPYKQSNILLDGKIYVYTECITSGKKPIAGIPQKLIGTGNYSDIFIDDVPSAIRIE